MYFFRRSLFAVGVLFLLVNCGRATDFLHYVRNEPPGFESMRRKVKEVNGYDRLDVLWVIDNSGSMSDHQRAVIANTQQFMDAFTSKNNLDWKMGLLSTHPPDAPFIGFTPTTMLDRNTADPVKAFKAAVGRLGLGQGCPELVFEPVMDWLKKYPDFTRKRSILAIIALTDTMEEVAGLQASFEKFLTGVKGDMRYVRFYGAFAGQSFGCASGEPPWTYPSSPFEYFVNLTGGKVFSLCKDFGKDLAAVGEEIATTVTHSKIPLKYRPVPSSIKVTYRGEVRPGGEKGDWFYDFDLNAVVFHNMDFTRDDEDSIEINYEKLK